MSAVKTAARYAFSVSLFMLILYLFDANNVLAAMAGANITSITIAAGFALGAQFFAAIRLQRLLVLQNVTLPLLKVFFIGLSAVFYGLVFPGGTVAAFAVRFVQLSRDARVELVGAALLVDRSIATVFLVLIGTVAFAIDQGEQLWVGIAVTGAIVGAGIFIFGRRTSARISGRLEKIANCEPSGRLHKFGVRVSGAMLNYSMANGIQVMIVLGTSLLAHLCGCLVYYGIAMSLGLDLSFLSVCWIRSAMILSTMIPVSVAGLGVREITAISLFIPLGYAEAQAVGFSILVFIVTPVITGLLGGFAELLGATGRR